MTIALEPWGPVEPLEPALSVRQVLALERVLAGEPEVVAGAGRLDRPVRWVHVAEAADVGVMLTGGEMVLTTGVLLAGDESAQTEYVHSLHRAEAAAVVLGLGRAFPTTPDAMRRAAERCGLPMIVLHRPFPFAELTEEVQSRLVRRKFAAVSLSEAVRTALTALITAGAPLQLLLDEIAQHAACPVVVTNLAHRVLATAGERSAVDDVLRDWERIARQAGGTEETAGSAPNSAAAANAGGRSCSAGTAATPRADGCSPTGPPRRSCCTACSAAPPPIPGRSSPRRACSRI